MGQLKATNGQNNPRGTLRHYLPPADAGRGTSIVIIERVIRAGRARRIAWIRTRRPTDSAAVTTGRASTGRTPGAASAAIGSRLR